jgi:hypothetical protein
MMLRVGLFRRVFKIIRLWMIDDINIIPSLFSRRAGYYYAPAFNYSFCCFYIMHRIFSEASLQNRLARSPLLNDHEGSHT